MFACWQTRRLPSKSVNERNGEWLLKNSILLKITEIWGIENVYQTEKDVCRAS